MITAQPISARILVKIEKKNEPLKNGLVAPDTTLGLPQEGVVVAVGSGKPDSQGGRVPMEVKTGDRVVFARYAGTEVKVDSQDCICLLYSEVDGILEAVA